LENKKDAECQHQIVQQSAHKCLCQLKIHKVLDVVFPNQVNRLDAKDNCQEQTEPDQNRCEYQFSQKTDRFFTCTRSQFLKNRQIIKMSGPDEVNCRNCEKVGRSPTKEQYKDTKQENKHERTPSFYGF
jgi:hypothetical protein